jgi:hypothetical protein
MVAPSVRRESRQTMRRTPCASRRYLRRRTSKSTRRASPLGGSDPGPLPGSTKTLDLWIFRSGVRYLRPRALHISRAQACMHARARADGSKKLCMQEVRRATESAESISTRAAVVARAAVRARTAALFACQSCTNFSRSTLERVPFHQLYTCLVPPYSLTGERDKPLVFDWSSPLNHRPSPVAT